MKGGINLSIPASLIVNITPRILSAGGNELEFNGLFLTKNSLVPLSSPVLTFTSAEAVGEYFGITSIEYAVSVIYFKGYDNSFAKPRHIHFARRVDVGVSAYIRGGAYTGELSAIKEITSGAFNIEVNGTSIEASSLDFSSATSFSDVATTLQTAMQSSLAGVLVSYSSLNKSFTVTSPTTGDNSTVTYASGSVADVLNMTADKGAILSQGSASMSVAENMAVITDATQNFVSFTTVYEAVNDEVVAMSSWASAKKNEYLFVGWTNDPNLRVQGSTNSIADIIEELGNGATELIYNNVDVATFVCGAIASIDFERYQGTINFAFKKVEGVSATVTNQTDADLLLEKGVSFMGNFATRNDDFTFFYDGKIFGDYGYIDTFINTIWFKNVMQLSVLRGLTNAGRVPYNDVGYSLIRAWLQDPINRAVNNGVIDTGISLSESQKAQIMNETGRDLTTELTTNGYAIIIEDAGANVRANRQSPNISVYYTYGGSVNKIDITSTAVV